jgi:hypothetical protein
MLLKEKSIATGNFIPLIMQAKDQVEKIANLLLPTFIPKDTTVNELTFHFTLPPNTNYKVWYEKTDSSDWKFLKFEEVDR